MSWFFGKKKHKESPTDSAEETSAVTSQSDDYILIEKQVNPFTPSPPTGNSSTPSGSGLYPFLGDGGASYPPVPPTLPQQTGLGDTQNYLSGVPFKLSEEFDRNIEIDRIRVDEILSYVLRIQNEKYVYDFGLEESVINEMESTAE